MTTKKPEQNAHTFLIINALMLLVLLFSSQIVLAQTQQREAFKRAWQALGRSNWVAADAERPILANYPLLPYILGEQMRQRPDKFSNDQILDYLQRHNGWSFTASLRNRWLGWLGRSGQYDVLLQHIGTPSSSLLKCYQIHAKMVLNGHEPAQQTDLIRDIQAVWLAGESLPKQCDAAFVWLQKQSGITTELAWQRIGLAMQAGETGLAGYLQRFLSSDDRVWLQRWLSMRNRRVSSLRAARQWPDESRAWQIVAWGLQQQARADAKAGAPLWHSLNNHFSWPDTISMPVLHSMGVFHALDLEPSALKTIDSVATDFQDQQLLEWRARTALANGLWGEVLNSVLRMSSEGQNDERWRYWQARALQNTGQIEAAQMILQQLSQQASYYGFLAADWVGQDYQICPAATPAVNNQPLPSQAVLERALELFQVGLTSHANRTWRTGQSDLDVGQRLRAAQMASDAGWLQQSIFTLNDAGHRTQYGLRFPLAYQQQLQQQTQKYGLDSALVHGLIRAESAWHPEAISGAGARGLMQVTPDTARRIARQYGLSYTGSASLLQPDTNIQFGTANLASLLTSFGNDPIALLAAYNAGPHVQQRWQQNRPANPPDIWVETLPYFETRDYIPRVLAFSLVYDWRLNGTAQPITNRMPGMQSVIGPATNNVSSTRAVNCVNTASDQEAEKVTP